MPKSAKRTKPPAPKTVPLKTHSDLRKAAMEMFNFQSEMERQSAIRLPYPGYTEVRVRLAKALGITIG